MISLDVSNQFVESSIHSLYKVSIQSSETRIQYREMTYSYPQKLASNPQLERVLLHSATKEGRIDCSLLLCPQS